MFLFVGDTVIDPFACTGATAVACVESERNSISVGIEPHYVEFMEERLSVRGIPPGQLTVDRVSDHSGGGGMAVSVTDMLVQRGVGVAAHAGLLPPLTKR
jgi:hypothetical protein